MPLNGLSGPAQLARPTPVGKNEVKKEEATDASAQDARSSISQQVECKLGFQKMGEGSDYFLCAASRKTFQSSQSRQAKTHSLQREQSQQHIPASPSTSRQKNGLLVGGFRNHLGTSAGLRKNLSRSQQFDLEKSSLTWDHAPTAEMSELFRLKDGLFLSSPCVAEYKGFLNANKVSHVVAIEEGSWHRIKQEYEGHLSSQPSLDTSSRNLTLYWHATEEARDPVWLKSGCALATGFQ